MRAIYVIIDSWHHGESWNVVGFTRWETEAEMFCVKAMPDVDDDDNPCKLVKIEGTYAMFEKHYFKYYKAEEIGIKP